MVLQEGCEQNKSKEYAKLKNDELPSKVYVHKNSPLTDLMGIKDFKTMYHVCISMLISLFINAFATDYIRTGEIKLGIHLIVAAFGKFHFVMVIWIFMFLSTLICFATFRLWANVRCKLNPKSFQESTFDKFGLFLIIAYYAVYIYFPVKLLLHFQLPPVSCFVVLTEQIRMLMKAHALVRSNTPKVLKYKSHAEQQEPIPNFTKFFYFMFAPTLVYRDEYPRTKIIRWSYVAKCLLEVLSTIFYNAFIVDHFFSDVFRYDCSAQKSKFEILLSILVNTMPSLLILLCMFYCLLHSWLNAWAEMLRFADRIFYKDWWNSTTYARYYRTWNVVVHDWLYTYIYKDMYETVCVGNKFASKIMVFFISAVFHEYILSFALGFFFPLLFFCFFTFGVLLTFINHKSSIGNVFLWYSLALGVSICLCLYGIEYFARLNCSEDSTRYLVPRFLTCQCP